MAFRRSLVSTGLVVVGTLFAAPSALATTASVSGATLTVTGTANADQIIVTLPGGDGITPDPVTGVPIPPPTEATPYEVTGTAVTAGAGCTATANGASCPRSGAFGAFTVIVNAGGGNDYVQTIMPNQALGDLAFLNGEAGNDGVFGSENEEVISGGAGDDLMDGGAGGDFMSGGTLTSHVPSFEGAVSQPATYSPGPGAGRDRIYGGGFDDQLTDGDVDTGTASATATAAFNNDIVDGGVCAGEALPDVAAAPTGVTTCPALAANVDNPEDHDAIMLAHRTKPLVIDVLVLTATQGGPGENETIRRIEAIWGGAANDTLYGRDGDFGDDSLRGNGGNDRLDARGGDDELLGGPGQDTLLGGAGADVINPGSQVVSQTATATTTTSDGPDYIDGGTNSTIIGGHSQSDLVTYEGRSEPMTLNMLQPTTLGQSGENDTIVGVEDIMGGHANDTIVGDGVKNLISGDPLPPIVNVPPDPPLPPGPPGGHFGNDHITTRDDHADVVDCTEGTADVHIADRLDSSINCESLDVPPLPVPACNDKADNDGDGRVDANDPGCESLSDNSESPDPATPRKCADKKDNDGDGLIDHPSDPGCSTVGDDDETDNPICLDAYRCFGGPSITGPPNAGRVTVARTGSFRLPRNFVTCPSAGSDCVVKTVVRARMRTAIRTKRSASSSAKKRKLRTLTLNLGGVTYAIRQKGASASAGQNRQRVRGKLSKNSVALLKKRKAIRSTVDVTVVWDATTVKRKISVILKPAKQKKRSKRR